MDASTIATSDEGVHTPDDPASYPDFDPAQIEDLASVLPAPQILSLAQSCRESVEAILAQIGVAAQAEDFTTIKEQAHDLKSASGSFGARRLQHLAEVVEYACIHGEQPDMAGYISAMQESFAVAWRAIETHLAA
jgi:HPt (histidine-containing phosphotransfer) domain-containing protein